MRFHEHAFGFHFNDIAVSLINRIHKRYRQLL